MTDTDIQESIIQQERDNDEACARGEHTLNFLIAPGSGALTWVCEDCR